MNMQVKNSGHLVLGFIIVFSSLALIDRDEEDWTSVRYTESIKVYSKKNSTGFKDIRIEADINVPLRDFVQFINDVEKYPQWVFKCQDARQVFGGETRLDYWIISDFPFPFRDREIKVNSTFVMEDNIFHSTSVADSAFKGDPSRIVIKDFNARWWVTANGSHSIKIEYEVSTHPGGSIPAWLVNMAVDVGPYRTMLNLKNSLESLRSEED